ncbi:unnamed protein product [Scomber scombrus]|uniref:Unnamed protein product n=1 Tax=Scomber scombrus TaxID=13677 RepID=A0AAV1NCN0_SCOSC
MKVQTLGDISSLTSCSLFGSLSTNHWAGPQEVTICGHHGDRVCGWALRLMCYLEQMKYDTERGGGETLPGGVGTEMERWTKKTEMSVMPRRQRAESKRDGDREPSSFAERGMDEKRRDQAFAPALYRTQGSAITHVLAAGRSGWPALALPSTPCCQVLLLLLISILSSAALYFPTNRQSLKLLYFML